MQPLYAIGDIHGQMNALQRALALVDADGGSAEQVVFLGDYTDRGPDSRGVLDILIGGRNAGRNWTFLRGNHDRMFQLFLQSPPQSDPHMMVELYWLHPRLGGDMTLASYGVDASGNRREKDVHAELLRAVPQSHVDFLNSLQMSFETDALFLAHAGIRPGVALADQSEEDLLWIRKEFHQSTADHPKLIIHGHTPVDAPTHYGNRINLDSGAGYGRRLSVAVFEGRPCWKLTDQGRIPLVPAS